MITVAMPSIGREDLVLAALTSLDNRLPVALVADGNWEPTPELRLAVRDTGGEILATGGECGIAKCWNLGVAWGLKLGADGVLILNDDIELPPFGYVFDELLEHYPERKCICLLDRMTASTLYLAMTPSKEWGQRSWPIRPGISTSPAGAGNPYPGGLYKFALKFALNAPGWLPCRMNGAAFLLRRDAYEKVGPFDEEFGWPGCFEDMDYWVRLLLTYGPEAMGTDARIFIHHWRGASMGFLDRIAAEAGVARNGAYFKGKWREKKLLIDWLSKANATPAEQPLPEGYPG